MRVPWILCGLVAGAVAAATILPVIADDTKAVAPPKKAEAAPAEVDPKALEQDGWEAHALTFAPGSHSPFPFRTAGGGTWLDAPPGTPLPLGAGVATGDEKGYLLIDTDGDGKPETQIKSLDDSVTVKYKDGEVAAQASIKFRYRMGDGKRQYVWQRNSANTGKVGKSTVALVDDNGNGSFNQWGADALAIGKSPFASPLSEVANIDGTVYRVRVDAPGKTLWTKKYEGEVGSVDLVSGYKAFGKLNWLVLTSGPSVFIDVAGSKEVQLPVGTYTIAMGEIGAGKMTAQIRNGTMAPIVVEAGKCTKVTWGMPVRFDFTYAINGGKVEIAWKDVRLVGAGKEEYYTFTPETITPKVEVKEDKTGKELRKGTMCLS